MNLQYRIDLFTRLGRYILSDNAEWQTVKEEAGRRNSWFIRPFVDQATTAIAEHFLDRDRLTEWVGKYKVPAENNDPKTIGVTMAGNIPLAGFHDFMTVLLSGHKIAIKLSEKDETLLKHLISKLVEWEPAINDYIQTSAMLKGCDAYIATGSNNTSRYFEYYFGKYPHIIRRNRTSVAIIEGNESAGELDKLADDVYQYFGLGCRNVTKLYVPQQYDFVPLLNAFKKYDHLADHHKFKNNYDYNLALLILDKQFYMSNESLLLTEEVSLFSPISRLNYEYYISKKAIENELKGNSDLQCIVGHGHIPFGKAQYPQLDDFADGVNTWIFLLDL